MSQDGLTHLKNPAAFAAARPPKRARPPRDIKHQRESV